MNIQLSPRSQRQVEKNLILLESQTQFKHCCQLANTYVIEKKVPQQDQDRPSIDTSQKLNTCIMSFTMNDLIQNSLLSNTKELQADTSIKMVRSTSITKSKKVRFYPTILL